MQVVLHLLARLRNSMFELILQAFPSTPGQTRVVVQSGESLGQHRLRHLGVATAFSQHRDRFWPAG